MAGLQASATLTGKIMQTHDFSKSFQLKLLDFNNVPDYVRNQFIEQEGRIYITTMSVPGRSISVLEYNYAGFTFRAPNAVNYSGSWQMGINVPADYLCRSALERWQFAIANEASNCGSSAAFPCMDTTIDLALLGPDCSVVRGYRLIGVFPSEIGEIAYNQETTDKVNFTVTFTYQRWEPLDLNESIDNPPSGLDSIYQSFESKIAAGVGGNCANKTNIPRI